jgi:hypothetical protein
VSGHPQGVPGGQGEAAAGVLPPDVVKRNQDF